MLTQEILQRKNMRNTISPIIFLNEEWKKIELESLDLRPIYWISTYGRVYNEVTGYIMKGHIVENGYVVVSFRTRDNVRVYRHVHRLMMLMFCPIENPELFVVNHKNGKKTDNYIWNLEWTTQKGNVEHAFRTGLRGCGERSSHAVFTNEQVHAVCRCMEAGMNNVEIASAVFGSPLTQQIRVLLRNVSSGNNWKEISSQYDISNYRKNNVFSTPQMHSICAILSSNKDATTDDILAILGIRYNSKDEYLMYHRVITNIRRGKAHINISSQYNL